MLHQDIKLEDAGPVLGQGIYASARIPRGTITWVRDSLDRSYTADAVARMPEMLQAAIAHYAYVERDGEYVLCWDLARFMNHSCRPNTTNAGEDFDIAIRDIEAGEQVTCDYGAFSIYRPLVCACGEPTCRRVIRPDDRERLGPLWEDEVRQALSEVFGVAQPLLNLVARNPRDLELLHSLKERKDLP